MLTFREAVWVHGKRKNQTTEMNESLYTEFRSIALTLINEGRTHYSADGILHVVRFNTRAQGNDDDRFKVNNNLSAEFSRRFIQEFPKHKDFFHLRKSKHDMMFEGQQRVFA